MNPEDISKMADKARKKQAKRKWKFTLNREEKPVFTPAGPESWRVYKHIYPYHMYTLLWFFFVLMVSIIFLMMYAFQYDGGEWMLYTGLTFLGAFVFRLLLFYTIKIFRFSSFKKWRATLPFTLTGWDKLGSKEDLPKTQYWNELIIVRVKLSSGTNSQTTQLIKDALFLLTSEANKCFYAQASVQSGYMGDIRKKWKFHDDLEVDGSGNGAVIGDIYWCIHTHLRAIHNAHGCIEKVSVEFSDRNYQVEPPGSD